MADPKGSAVTATAAPGVSTAGASGTQPVVALRDVFCVHRTAQGDAAALQGANLEVSAEEIVCLLGPSGAGKSTLLRVIAGLQVPSAGNVLVFGTDVGRLSRRRRAQFRHRTLGSLSQHSDAALSPELTVGDLVARPLALRDAPRAIQRQRVAELLAAAGLAGRAGALPGELSGGERQRVALCAALAHRPALLLADEPTGELDTATADSVRALLLELARREGTTVVIVSHDPASAAIADRRVLLRDGRVAEDRRPGEDTVLVGRDGWLHVAPELLASAGIRHRAHVRLAHDGVLVTGTGSEVADPAPVTALRSSPPGWEAARAQLRSATRRRGNRVVLDAVSHDFAAGRLTAVIGPSGVGKTTLLSLIAGLDHPDAGEVMIDGQPLCGWDGEQLATLRRSRIGYLAQEPAAVGFLSAEENIVLSLRIRGWDDGPAAERAAMVLAWLGLSERARQRVARLSAGETQRVALGRAVASARGLLVVDEPTSRLGRTGAATVAELLRDAASADNQTVLCATHDPELVARADAVIDLG